MINAGILIAFWIVIFSCLAAIAKEARDTDSSGQFKGWLLAWKHFAARNDWGPGKYFSMAVGVGYTIYFCLTFMGL